MVVEEEEMGRIRSKATSVEAGETSREGCVKILTTRAVKRYV
jgi:hypothetical protein